MHLKRETTFSTASVKRYLQVTDKQFSEAAGVAQGVAPAQVIGKQGISENSPTLKNKAFPIIDLHGQSQEMPLVGDEGLEAFGSYPLFNRLRPVLVKQLGAHTGAKLPLSQVVALLIERWDYMTSEEQGSIITLLQLS